MHACGLIRQTLISPATVSYPLQAAERYFIGVGGVTAWQAQEEQTGGKESQSRRHLWFQVRQLMDLVEEVAASRSVDVLPAAEHIDDALAGASLGVAGASRSENKERVRTLLGLPSPQED